MKFRLLWLVALLVVTAAVGLHLHFVGHAGGFWRDEVNTINVASHDSLDEFRKDSFPVLFPLLVHGWLAGFGETSLRMLGLLIGLGILVTLLVAGWKTSRTPPLIALVLFAFNPTLLVVGDSLRAYGLGTWLIAVVMFAAAWFLLRPDWKRFGWLTLACVLSVQVLYHNAVFVGAICLGAMAVCWRRKNFQSAAQIFGAGFLAAISLLPYWAGVAAGRADSAALRTGLDPLRLLNGLGDTFGFPMLEFSAVWLLLFIGLLIHAGWLWRTNKESSAPENFSRDLPIFAAVTVTVSIFGFVAFLWLAALPSQGWYFLPLLAVSAVGLDLAWPQWPEKIRLALVTFLVLSAVVMVPLAWRILETRFTNVDVWTRQLQKSIAPGDYVIVDPWYCGITFAHYFTPTNSWDTLPPLTDHATHRYDLVKLQLQNTNAIAPVLEKISATLSAGHRVWIVALWGWMDIPETNTVAAPTLPPAPLGQYGWSEVPYTFSWVSQVAHRLGDQSVTFERVKNPDAAGRFMEETELFMAEGWRGATNAAAK
ncbi:MAG: hypothetical protein RL616_419 [Verrucomicrobiota bacterium]